MRLVLGLAVCSGQFDSQGDESFTAWPGQAREGCFHGSRTTATRTQPQQRSIKQKQMTEEGEEEEVEQDTQQSPSPRSVRA